jgi:hypothetical protein
MVARETTFSPEAKETISMLSALAVARMSYGMSTEVRVSPFRRLALQVGVPVQLVRQGCFELFWGPGAA